MKTNLNIPDALIIEAMEILDSKSANETIIKALENSIKMHKLKKLASFRGKIDLKVDLDMLRGRDFTF